MSSTLSLTRGYGSFFWGCAKFGVSPYTSTFLGIATAGGCRDQDALEHVVAATAVCGILTFIVPVLPILTTITCTLATMAAILATMAAILATMAAILAACTMVLTYPVALAVDACSAPDLDDALSFSSLNYA
jgi:hypothetical protein